MERAASDANAYLRRSRKHMSHYDKGNLDVAALEPGIADAVNWARKRAIPPAADWPRREGTTVHRLVERLLDAGAIRT